MKVWSSAALCAIVLNLGIANFWLFTIHKDIANSPDPTAQYQAGRMDKLEKEIQKIKAPTNEPSVTKRPPSEAGQEH